MTRHGIALQTAAGNLIPQISQAEGRAVSYSDALAWLENWLHSNGWIEPDLLGTRATRWARSKGMAMTVTVDNRGQRPCEARLTHRGHTWLRNHLIGRQTLQALAKEFQGEKTA